jgi:hypothetical protein
MPIFPNTPEFQALKSNFDAADAAFSQAIKDVLAFQTAPGTYADKRDSLAEATSRFERAGAARTDAYEKMLELRIDKD